MKQKTITKGGYYFYVAIVLFFVLLVIAYKMLSLGLTRCFHNYNLNTQILHIDKEYFRRNPQTSILHFTDKRYIVFLWEENGEPKIFDPSYGIVYLSPLLLLFIRLKATDGELGIKN